MIYSKISANIVLAVTLDPFDISNLGNGFNVGEIKDKSGIKARIQKSTEFIANQAFRHNGDSGTHMSVKVLSIVNNVNDSNLVDILVKVQLCSLIIDPFLYEVLLGVVSKDFLCYFDKMGWTIIKSITASNLWYQEDIPNNEVHTKLGSPDEEYSITDTHNKIEYVLYRDSMSITLDDYEGLLDEFNDNGGIDSPIDSE